MNTKNTSPPMVKVSNWSFEHINKDTGEIIEGVLRKNNLKKMPKENFIMLILNKTTHFDNSSFDGFLVRLYGHLEYYTNRLITIGTVPKALTQKDFADIFSTKGKSASRSTVQRFLREAKEKNIIRQIEGKKDYYLNPSIARHGKEYIDEILKLFNIKTKLEDV